MYIILRSQRKVVFASVHSQKRSQYRLKLCFNKTTEHLEDSGRYPSAISSEVPGKESFISHMLLSVTLCGGMNLKKTERASESFQRILCEEERQSCHGENRSCESSLDFRNWIVIHQTERIVKFQILAALQEKGKTAQRPEPNGREDIDWNLEKFFPDFVK